MPPGVNTRRRTLTAVVSRTQPPRTVDGLPEPTSSGEDGPNEDGPEEDPAVDDPAAMERRVSFSAAERLMFFSDAVVAIAITLLALELPVPAGDTAAAMGRDLASHANEFVAFLISFVVIASHWVVHYQVFRYVRRAPRGLVGLNLIWLLLIIVTPFTTRVLNVGTVNLFSFSLYALTQACEFALFSIMVQVIISGGHVQGGTDPRRLRTNLLHTVPMALAFALSVPLYLLVQQAAFALWFAVPVGSGVWGRVAVRRRRREH